MPINLFLNILGLLLLIINVGVVIYLRQQHLKGMRANHVFASLPDAIIVVDEKAQVLDINSKGLAILGGTLKETQGVALAKLLPEYTTILENYQHTGNKSAQISLPRPTQTSQYQVTITPLENNATHHVIVLSDITTCKIAEKEREDLIKTLDDYAHTVAHDLKNPLSVVLGYSDLLQSIMNSDVPPTSEELMLSLEFIRKGAESSIGIVNALLLLANVSGKSSLKLEKLDMALTIDVTIQSLTRLIEEHHATITIDDLLPSIGYAPWIFEVCMNYVSNAIKYGGKPPSVHVSSQLDGDFVRYTVRDNGQGLSSDEQKQLFVQFGRLDRHKMIEGHGLGLSIVQQIITRLGGRVGIISEKGKGSEFYFTLPKSK